MFIFIINAYSDTLILNDNQKTYKNFGQKIEFYKDDSCNINLFDVKNKLFYENKKKNIIFKYTNSAYWFKLRIINNSENKKYIIDAGNAIIDNISVFYFKNDELSRAYYTGMLHDKRTRAIKSNTFAFPLDFNETNDYTVFIRVKTSKSMFVPLTIKSYDKYKEDRNFDNIFNSVFYALLVLMFFYNLFIYLISKVDVYKFYLSYILGFGVFLFFYDGYSLYLLFGEYPRLNNTFLYFFYMLIFVSVSTFSTKLLQDDNEPFSLNLLLSLISNKVMPFVVFFVIVCSLFFQDNLYLIGKLIIVLTMMLGLLIITTFIRNFIRNKQFLSRVYVVIWIIFIFITLSFIINIVLGMISVELMSRILKISIVFEIVFMSLLIAYKLKVSNEENYKLELKNKEQELYILRQTRLASFGEILNSIVHEWKQPLHRINMISMDLEITYNKGDLTKDYLSDQLNEIEYQTKYMNDTVNGFLDYFSPQKEKEEFFLLDCINEAIKLLSVKFTKNDINYLINCSDTSIKTIGYKKEYTQVIIIILNNSIDAIIKEKIENPTIVFEVIEEDKKPLLSITDNANGIKIEPIDKIFDANVSTKDEKVSSGIGLFIAKRIIEDNMNKKLTCKNHYNGAKFSIIG